MTAKRFQLLAMDVVAGAGFVRTPQGGLIAIYPSDPEGVPMTELEMEASITRPGFPYGFGDLRGERVFFNSIADVREELRRKRVYPVYEPLIPQWDPKRNLMRFATEQQLERLLIRAFQEFIPAREFTAALRVAEGMQYAKNTSLTLCAMAADVARNICTATDSTSEHKEVAHRVLNIWREKLGCVLRDPKLYSRRQEVNQFLETAKEDNLKKLLGQIEGSLNFLEEDLRFKDSIASRIKERAIKVGNEELTRRAEVVLKKIDELNRINAFCEEISERGIAESLFMSTRDPGLDLGVRRRPELEGVAV